MKKQWIQEAFFKSLSVFTGYLLIGFGFGMTLRNAGYGLGWALGMSLFIYAGSMQYVGISLLTAPAGLLTALITTLVINARHLFYSVSMVGRYRNTGLIKPYLIFSLTDETYALVSQKCVEDRPDGFFLLISLLHHIYWILGTVLGSLCSLALPFDTSGVTFSMTALFVASYVQQWRSGENRLPAAMGMGIALLCRLVFGREFFLIPSMVLICVSLLILKPKEETEGE